MQNAMAEARRVLQRRWLMGVLARKKSSGL
jgi:hypothetical protein